MRHLVENQNILMKNWLYQMHAVRMHTTGPDPSYHEICELCFMPLTSSLERRHDMPFQLKIRPNHLDRLDKPFMNSQYCEHTDVIERGVDSDGAKDIFHQWYESLEHRYNRYGTRRRVMLLGWNTDNDIAFLKNWLGALNYSYYYADSYRDVRVVVEYLNDKSSWDGQPTAISKVDLQYICTEINITMKPYKHLIHDCACIAEVYRTLLHRTRIVVSL